ncbi:MAG: uroporphyrinogen-III C-methyltransferase [Anaerolineales bacterium]
MTGKVYLVGGGPGDPDLITVKGLRLLRNADVVLYDRLISPDLLNEVRATAELIPVGKAPGQHAVTQAEIDALLVAKAQTAEIIVRLKGGDPFVFGQGGEECQVLAQAGIPFEVVPGISSAFAVPAYAGIPLTHRDYASQFTVVTARDRDGNLPDWDNLPRQGTLVFLMGVARLPEIAAGLQSRGWAAETPAAVIHRGTTPDQQVVVSTLDQISVQAAHLKSPSVIVVGEVVSLSAPIHWFSPEPAFS